MKRSILEYDSVESKKVKVPEFRAAQLFRDKEVWQSAVKDIKERGGCVHPTIASFIRNGEVNILQI